MVSAESSLGEVACKTEHSEFKANLGALIADCFLLEVQPAFIRQVSRASGLFNEHGHAISGTLRTYDTAFATMARCGQPAASLAVEHR